MNKFRYDINGLRAYAVLFVVLFHFGIFGFTGGFIGVDVFFVISGFLMTKIIMDGLQKNNFSILQFYTNRAVRIIPALAVLCIFLLILGWFELIPFDYRSLSKHVIGSLLFVSNIIYWKESGYFDVDSHEKILLHTWSLSVEWQFYLFLPIYLIIAYKLLKHKTIYALILLFICSLALAHVISTYRPSASFFLLPTRAWEMILGGFLYFLPKPNLKDATSYLLEIIGFSLIIASLYLFNAKTPWSSIYTLVPTIGTALILYTQNQKSIFTNNKIAQFLGNASYSIYLWHWPIVFWLFHKNQQNNIIYLLVGIIISITLGYLSAKYVEKFIGNQLKGISLFKSNLIISMSCIVIIGLGLIIFKTNGINSSIRAAANTPQAVLIEKYINEHKNLDDAYWLQCDAYSNLTKYGFNGIDQSCINQPLSNKSIFLWGDSHSQALSLGLRTSFKNFSFYQIGSSGCKASLEASTTLNGEFKQACDNVNQIALKEIERIKPTFVIIAQENHHDLSDWKSITSKLKSLGVNKVMIIGAVPQWRPSLPKVIVKDSHFSSIVSKINDTGLDMDIIEHDAKAKTIVTNLNDHQVKYISLIDQMCDLRNSKYYCETKIGSDLLQVDYGHLSRKGSIYVVNNYIKPNIK
ncbi:peptidoglycan/LPS O-acetylase OafA/YrhL [Acinetobacter bereziniae]|uniref:acyltransferase family protein n=1 Tax=Acinetobacter bereziniae TaxID=106648 RepID=UPI002864884A|nr:acyltransferase family protein [Acinetobacter bereziniae]MDR6543225.1 peptidoglycan/LPS O-acetylase OafA/YrhL [Acinetobacter bereziniae]